jgi:predicted transcriptional regulator
MPKEAVFTMKLEADLRAEFMAAAAGEDRPASQVMRELMRQYIADRQQAKSYDDYLRSKVEAGRASMNAGRGRSNEDVEAGFAARRNKTARS